MGSRNFKTIKGKSYMYYIIYEGGRKRAIYCGLASKPDSEKRALTLELEEIQSKMSVLGQKASSIRTRLDNFRGGS